MLMTFGNFSMSQSDNKEYSKVLKKMFEISGAEESFKGAIKQMVVPFKNSYTGIEEKFWDELEKEFLKTSLNDLTEMLVPVYQKQFSIEELNGIILFYESEIGRKYAKAIPVITVESMEVGQKWGAQIGQKIGEKIAKENK